MLGLAVLSAACWLAVGLAEAHSELQRWALSIALAPAGATLRYVLSGLCVLCPSTPALRAAGRARRQRST